MPLYHLHYCCLYCGLISISMFPQTPAASPYYLSLFFGFIVRFIEYYQVLVQISDQTDCLPPVVKNLDSIAHNKNHNNNIGLGVLFHSSLVFVFSTNRFCMTNRPNKYSSSIHAPSDNWLLIQLFKLKKVQLASLPSSFVDKLCSLLPCFSSTTSTLSGPLSQVT